MGNVKRISKSGGTVETIATDLGLPGGLTLTPDQIYWGTLGSSSLGSVPRYVYRANLDGTDRSEFEPFQGAVDSVVSDDEFVYWNDRGVGTGTTFHREPLGSTGSAITIGSDPNAASSIAVGAGCLYVRVGINSLTRLCPGANAVGVFSTTTSLSLSPQQSSDATMLYFGVLERGLLRLTLTTGAPQATDVIAGTDVRSAVVDGDSLYYVDGDTGGAPACTNNWGLYRTAKTPGGVRVELLPPPMDCPRSLVTDSEAIYWINFDTGVIMKLAKPALTG